MCRAGRVGCERVQWVCVGVAKWCGRGRVAAEATAVGDDAALSVFTQLAGYGRRRRRRGRNSRRGESRTRITRSPETRRAFRIITLYYYTKRTRGWWEGKGKIRRSVDRDRRSESRRSLTYIPTRLLLWSVPSSAGRLSFRLCGT